MERLRGITISSTLIIVFGVYNLVSLGNYEYFSLMLQPLPNLLIAAIYIFGIIYGVSSVYCGSNILKLEDWARKCMVSLCIISVMVGFFLNKIVITNFKAFLMSGKAHVTPDIVGSMYTYAVVLTAVTTIFELVVIYYFTRPRVIAQFK